MSRKAWDHGGKSRQARGYGAAWDKLRSQVLSEEPACKVCMAKGIVTASAEVDHIKPKAQGGTDDRTNLRGICVPCHRIKTAEERGFKVKRKPTFDTDGWPID